MNIFFVHISMFELDEKKIEKATSGEVLIQCGPLHCVFEVRLSVLKIMAYAINSIVTRHH